MGSSGVLGNQTAQKRRMGGAASGVTLPSRDPPRQLNANTVPIKRTYTDMQVDFETFRLKHTHTHTHTHTHSGKFSVLSRIPPPPPQPPTASVLYDIVRIPHDMLRYLTYPHGGLYSAPCCQALVCCCWYSVSDVCMFCFKSYSGEHQKREEPYRVLPFHSINGQIYDMIPDRTIMTPLLH